MTEELNLFSGIKYSLLVFSTYLDVGNVLSILLDDKFNFLSVFSKVDLSFSLIICYDFETSTFFAFNFSSCLTNLVLTVVSFFFCEISTLFMELYLPRVFVLSVFKSFQLLPKNSEKTESSNFKSFIRTLEVSDPMRPDYVFFGVLLKLTFLADAFFKPDSSFTSTLFFNFATSTFFSFNFSSCLIIFLLLRLSLLICEILTLFLE
jgi:hypothetical protein